MASRSTLHTSRQRRRRPSALPAQPSAGEQKAYATASSLDRYMPLPNAEPVQGVQQRRGAVWWAHLGRAGGQGQMSEPASMAASWLVRQPQPPA